MKFIFLALIVSVFCSSCQETVTKRRTVGYKGEAKTNAFLAAKRFLNQQGYQASSEHGLGKLDATVSTIFIPPSSLNTVGRSKNMLEWVVNGGHLVIMFEGGELGGNDFVIVPKESFWGGQEEVSEGVDHLLTELDVVYDQGYDLEDVSAAVSGAVSSTELDIDDWEKMEEKDRVLLDSEKSELNLGGNELALHHWTNKSFRYDSPYEGDYVSSGGGLGAKAHRYVSLSHGIGRVSFLSDARPLRNRYLAYGDHAEFLAGIVDLSRPGEVIFSSGDGIGFFAMVWRNFKFAVIGLLVLVILWLWRHLPRYGPQQDIGDANMREFSDQIQGIGRFLWRHKRDDALIGALRAHLNRRLSLHPGVSDEGIFDQLADLSGLPIESIIEAMTREHITEPGVMVRVTQNLQKILTKIH